MTGTQAKSTVMERDIAKPATPPQTQTAKVVQIAPTVEEKAKPVAPPQTAKPVLLLPEDFSELGLAEVFVDRHGTDYRFSDSRGMLHYDGTDGTWRADTHALQCDLISDLDRMQKWAKATKENAELTLADYHHLTIDGSPESEKQQDQMAKIQDKVGYADEVLKFAKQMRTAGKVNGVFELMKHLTAVKDDIFDSNAYTLNTPAGIVDLLTGQITPHDRKAYCTKCTTVSPSQDGMDTWYEFLDTVACGDDSLKGFLQLVVGMCLIGTVKTEKVIFLIGGGSNGKSTFTGSVMAVLGDYATTIDSEVLLDTRRNMLPAMATLCGVRMALASELAENRRIDTGQLKKLSSTDRITAERKFMAPESFRPSHTLILQSNYLPRIDALDRGTWRRVMAIPFDAVIDASEAIENYSDLLVQEAGGAILKWSVDGAVNFATNKFKLDPIPEAVEEATSEYHKESNWIEEFMTDCIDTDTDDDAPAHEVYLAYKEWAEDHGMRPRSEQAFGRAMRTAGHGSEHTRNGSIYQKMRIEKV